MAIVEGVAQAKHVALLAIVMLVCPYCHMVNVFKVIVFVGVNDFKQS